jgi:hypothetical protein
MSEFIFPFNTCETANTEGIAQPYSVFFNVLNCIIVFVFLLKTTNFYTMVLLGSIFSFELFHTFSHVIHIEGSLQTNIAHILSYFVNFSFLYAFYSFTKQPPNLSFILYLVLLIVIDIYFFMTSSIFYYLTSQSLIFISLFLYYFSLLPKFVQNNIYKILFSVGLVILLLLNEIFNCKTMLEFYPHFPYHIFIEIAGIIAFYVISSTFYRL